MKKVDRSEILDLGAYEQIRERFRARIIEAKKHRRLAVGPHMTLIWENRDTVLFQVQEMLRTERITQTAAVQHELDTYNELVPARGQLSATLMIEYEDASERRVALDRLASLRDELTLQVGTRTIRGVFRDQPGEEAGRLPAVNYVTFDVGDVADVFEQERDEVIVRVTNTYYKAAAALPPQMRRSLAADLREP